MFKGYRIQTNELYNPQEIAGFICRIFVPVIVLNDQNLKEKLIAHNQEALVLQLQISMRGS